MFCMFVTLLWCVIDDDNVAVLLHSVIHDFVVNIFVSEYWNCFLKDASIIQNTWMYVHEGKQTYVHVF